MNNSQTLDYESLTSLEEQARDMILNHRRLFNQLDCLHFSVSGDTLIVTGQLPTFYLKQLLQTALMELDEIHIVNRVEVICKPIR